MNKFICIICHKEAELIYGGNSLCKEHFNKKVKENKERAERPDRDERSLFELIFGK